MFVMVLYAIIFEMNDLRSCILFPKGMWTLEQIRAGFAKFYQEYKRYPTALEIDAYEFLPSSRSLQRSYGGLVSIRQRLFPNEIHNFTTGEYRSKVASSTYRRAQDYEETFYDKLCEHFEPIAIHEHKVVRPGRVTSDFYIYHDDNSGVCLDLFYAKDMFSVAGVINIKIRRYAVLQCPVVFVLLHDGSLSQARLDAYLVNRKTLLPDNIKVITEEAFWQEYVPALKRLSVFVRK
jgi:hypothetical protein